MKKIFLFAATAALLTACSSEELTGLDNAQQSADANAIKFSVYTPRTVTRAGSPLANSTAKIAIDGFGVMGYYTDDEKYDKENAKPDYMYNTKVWSASAGDPYTWQYNPVMYWPNEYGTAATSANIDYVSFFAYAPYIDVTNETGIPVLEPIADYDAFAKALGIKYAETELKTLADKATFQDYMGAEYADDAAYVAAVNTKYSTTFITAAECDIYLAGLGITFYNANLKSVEDLAGYKKYLGTTDDNVAKAALDEINKTQVQGTNITALSKNNASGDPIVKYVVDTNPATSVDLLWGVAAYQGADPANYYYTSIIDGYTPVVQGKPFVDLTKPKKPATDKLSWNLQHALAKLKVNIKYLADNTTNPEGASEEINNKETRIYVRSIKIGGFVMKGALDLNSTETVTRHIGLADVVFGVPLWKGFDGKTALTYETVTFKDGRKDGKEGTYSGADKNEAYLGLNPDIIENYSVAQWPNGKTSGVTKDYVNLFGGDKNLPIFVIPTNEDIDIEIVYDVETKDDALDGYLSDGVTHGSTITNTIRKTSKEIFGTTDPVIMEHGYGYNINIILGMTSAKFEAAVVGWDAQTAKDVDLPKNN